MTSVASPDSLSATTTTVLQVIYMPSIVLDPTALPVQYPKATPHKPQKVRIIAQVSHFDVDTGLLTLTKVPNLPDLNTHIILDGDKTEPVPINTADIDVDAECLRKGNVVSVWGNYDGSQVNAWDCHGTNGEELLDGGSEILAEASHLTNL
ncbi:hypothetical protein CJJ07_002073 [Candidozyma auris]|nr:hypothetical protein CJJ07_002073 [[Candida] auris]QEL62932.1 hypothetical protein CJJ09_005116 [[Candida] auris]